MPLKKKRVANSNREEPIVNFQRSTKARVDTEVEVTQNVKDNERLRVARINLLDQAATRLLDKLTHASSRGVGRVEARAGCSFETLVCNSMLKSYVIQIEDREMLVDLILMDMYDYDIILGMDGLAAYHASVDYFRKEVVFWE